MNLTQEQLDDLTRFYERIEDYTPGKIIQFNVLINDDYIQIGTYWYRLLYDILQELNMSQSIKKVAKKKVPIEKKPLPERLINSIKCLYPTVYSIEYYDIDHNEGIKQFRIYHDGEISYVNINSDALPDLDQHCHSYATWCMAYSRVSLKNLPKLGELCVFTDTYEFDPNEEDDSKVYKVPFGGIHIAGTTGAATAEEISSSILNNTLNDKNVLYLNTFLQSFSYCWKKNK